MSRTFGSIVTGTIWHVSDLHVTARVRPRGRPPDGVPEPTEAHDEQLAFAKAYFAKKEHQSERPDVLVITGDLVERGGWEYEAGVTALIEGLRKSLALPENRVLIIPGNHDVNRETARSSDTSARPLSRDDFKRVTQSYTTPGDPARYHEVPDLGLAFLLSDTVPYNGVPIGAARLNEDLERKLGSAFNQGVREIVNAALASDTASIPVEQLVAQLDAAEGRHDAVKLFTILLSHYPLVPHPHGDVNFKEYHVPAGAGQGMKALASRHTQLALHGHHHRYAVQSCALHDDVPFSFFNVGAPRWANSSDGEHTGFNVLKYAVNTSTGEARVRIERARFVSAKKLELVSTAKLAFPPHGKTPAESVRLTERINLFGDARTDMWISGLSTTDWPTDDDGQRVHRVKYDMQALGSQMLPSLSVEVLSPQGIERPTVRPASIGTETAAKAEDGVTALSSRTDQLMGEIEVRTEADIQRVSLGVRFFGNHSYAGTLGDRVRSFGSPSEIPKLDYDQEAFTYLIREPTQRLEIFLRTPDEAPPLHQLKVRSFVNVGTTLLPADEILSLSEFTVQSWPGAKRVRLTVKEPLQGVSYGLIWQLRDERPRLARERQKIDLAISQAEHVRRLMTQARTDGELSNHLRSTYYDDFFQKVLALAERTKLAEGNSRKKLDAIEVAILVPKSPLLSYADFEGTWNDPTRVRATPRLHAVSASYSPEDRRFLSAEMDVGCGIAGRAFAINDAAAYHADRDIALQGNEADPLSHASVYLQLRDESGTDIPRHSVLYAIPLRHWLHRSVVIGCVCIGAYGRTKLDLEGTDPLSKGDSAFDVVVRWGTELAKSLWEDGG